MVWLIGDVSSTQNIHWLRLRSLIYLQEHSRFTQTSTATLIFTNSWSRRHAFDSYSRKSSNRLMAYPQKHQSSDISSHYTSSLIHFTFREMWATQVESYNNSGSNGQLHISNGYNQFQNGIIPLMRLKWVPWYFSLMNDHHLVNGHSQELFNSILEPTISPE